MNVERKFTVLLVEDEKSLSSIIVDTLEGEGFSTLQAFDGSEGLKLFLDKRPDILVAGVMMPKMDGFEMAARIRATNKTPPVLFLTARSAIDDLVSGFELGANDCLRKPFKMRELTVRVKVLLNRAVTDKNALTVFNMGSYTFDSISQTLAGENDMQELTHFENEILKRLCTNINHVVDIRSLLSDLWYDDNSCNRNSLHGYIHKLRKLLINGSRVKIINERGIGYKLIFR